MPDSRIVAEPIRPEEVLAGLASTRDGASVLFLGIVRDHNEGRPVVGIRYEAYREMAERTLAGILEEASRRYGTDRIRVTHRVGELEVGEVSTAIAVATPHRAEAFEASRYILEQIKRRLPIWKRERYQGGESAWVEGTEPAPGGREPGSPPEPRPSGEGKETQGRWASAEGPHA